MLLQALGRQPGPPASPAGGLAGLSQEQLASHQHFARDAVQFLQGQLQHAAFLPGEVQSMRGLIRASERLLQRLAEAQQLQPQPQPQGQQPQPTQLQQAWQGQGVMVAPVPPQPQAQALQAQPLLPPQHGQYPPEAASRDPLLLFYMGIVQLYTRPAVRAAQGRAALPPQQQAAVDRVNALALRLDEDVHVQPLEVREAWALATQPPLAAPSSACSERRRHMRRGAEREKIV